MHSCGHSDGDAVAHAVTDAILGAAGLGDIGEMFPDTDAGERGPRLDRDADARASRACTTPGWRVGNVDVTVIAEQPKIGPHREAMRARLAAALGVDADDVSIKGKTNEGMGWIGRGEGLGDDRGGLARAHRAVGRLTAVRHRARAPAPVLSRLLDWFVAPPAARAVPRARGAAAAENVFPPLPADTVVAFGSFLAARGSASAVGAFVATLAGNLAGAMFMYWVGARYGAERVLKRLGGGAAGQEKLQALYGRYGVWALVVSRFLPGVRALVPPFAGALRLGFAKAAIAMGLASAVWYGAISYFAFPAGANFESLQARIAQGQKWLGIGASVLVVLGLFVWWWRRRRSATS